MPGLRGNCFTTRWGRWCRPSISRVSSGAAAATWMQPRGVGRIWPGDAWRWCLATLRASARWPNSVALRNESYAVETLRVGRTARVHIVGDSDVRPGNAANRAHIRIGPPRAGGSIQHIGPPPLFPNGYPRCYPSHRSPQFDTGRNRNRPFRKDYCRRCPDPGNRQLTSSRSCLTPQRHYRDCQPACPRSGSRGALRFPRGVHRRRGGRTHSP